jgi:hypothetical protein
MPYFLFYKVFVFSPILSAFVYVIVGRSPLVFLSLFSYELLLYADFPFCCLALAVILASVFVFLFGCLLGLSLSICVFYW